MTSLELVRQLLGSNGIYPSSDELEALAEAVAGQQVKIDALYEVEEARYESPATVFRAQL